MGLQTCVAAELSRQFLVSLLAMDAFSAIALSPAEFSKEIAAAAEGPAGSLLLVSAPVHLRSCQISPHGVFFFAITNMI